MLKMTQKKTGGTECDRQAALNYHIPTQLEWFFLNDQW
jgi:hypothetical protein